MNFKNALAMTAVLTAVMGVFGDYFQQTPYVQHPATNAMSLIWFTDSACTATVKWWPEAGDAATAQSASTTGVFAQALTNNLFKKEFTAPKYRHRHRITGLAAGTRYAYSVTLPSGESYSNTFKTAPDANSSIRFMYFNDSETKPNNPNTTDWADPHNNDRTRTYYITPTEGYRQGLLRMKSRNPDLFVMAGDLAWEGGYQTHWDEFWRHNAGGNGSGYDDPAGSIPILAAIGNHDLKDVSSDLAYAGASRCENTAGGELALERYLSYFEYEPNGVDFSDVDNRDRSQMFHRVDYGPVTLIFIDTNNGDDSDPEKDTNTGLFRDPAVAGSYGLPAARSPDFNPGSKQYTWLTNQLADAQQKAKFTFVVNHQCPYSTGYHNRVNVSESGEWLSARAVRVLRGAMLKYGVDGWLCGHDEMMEHARIEGEETLPDGTTRPHHVDVFDMGTIGNGLRGGFITNEGKNLVKTQRVYEDGTKDVFRAYVDEPEVWENGVLVAGGVHYTHMEVDVKEVEPGLWTCTMTPNYLFTSNYNGVVGSEWRTYNDVLVLTNDLRAPVVPEGMLVLKTAGTLARAMAVEGASLAEISSYTQIVVDCHGTIQSDTAIADWTGDLRIRSGSVLEVTAKDALGAASGKIFIENGGQLKMAMATAATWVQTKKTCYFEGEGPDGMGALYNTSPNHENGNCLWPYTLVMTGDARWSNGASSGSQDVFGGSIDMNGHTLTYGVNGRFHNVTIRNPGHIVVVKGGMLIQGNCNFGGTDENTITFKSGAVCRFWGSPGTSHWTLILDPGSSLYPGNGVNDWQGPVFLNAPIPMTRWNEDIVMRFTNVVSGVGGITYASGRTTRMTLHLSNPDNDFQGGVSLNESTLQLTASGALPMSGGAARIKNGTVLLSGLTHYDLPAAELMATGMVLNGTGRWHGGLVKKEAGTLVYESGVGGDLLDIQGGCVKFVRSNRGLFEGIVTGQGLFDAAWNAGLCPTNAIADCPRYSYLNTSSGWKDYMYVSYTGYLWNRSSEPVVWTFGCDIDDNAQLAINDTVVINHAGWTKPSFGTVTLNPGANKFTWRMVNWTGGGGGTAGQNNPWSLAKALAYHVGATESTNPADYTAFTAADAGTLFTITDGTNPDELKQFLPVFNKVRLASGTELDLNGFSYVVQELEGPGRVSNGQLTVASKWTMSAADIRTGNSFETTDALAFAEGAVVDVSDIAQLPVVSSGKAYVLGRAAQVTGTPAVSSALAVQKWRVRVEENVVKLYHNSGITIFVR